MFTNKLGAYVAGCMQKLLRIKLFAFLWDQKNSPQMHSRVFQSDQFRVFLGSMKVLFWGTFEDVFGIIFLFVLLGREKRCLSSSVTGSNLQ